MIDKITLIGGSLKVGDVITFAPARPKWYKKFWRWLMRYKEPPLRQFIITNATSNTEFDIKEV